MARCNSCSAPLPANINRCHYCNVRNDVDLHSKHKFSIQTKHSNRICPHCNTQLQTIKLDVNGPFLIERCKSCFGLFFDLGEIDLLLDNSVSNVTETNLTLIKNINRDRYPADKKVKYIKCPVCNAYMKRVNFGYRSGVIIDQCAKHGIWVDSGEISHLLEWKKAGGQLLHGKEKTTNNQKDASPSLFDQFDSSKYSKNNKTDILETVSDVIYNFFNQEI